MLHQPGHIPRFPILHSRACVRLIAVRVHAEEGHERWPVGSEGRLVEFGHSLIRSEADRDAAGVRRIRNIHSDVVVPPTAMVWRNQERDSEVSIGCPTFITIVIVHTFTLIAQQDIGSIEVAGLEAMRKRRLDLGVLRIDKRHAALICEVVKALGFVMAPAKTDHDPFPDQRSMQRQHIVLAVRCRHLAVHFGKELDQGLPSTLY
mmetsp:Transcript_19811/g.55102  ORF Transcript_19811/g.55102 Transcript_19811/m.55102 type:complete len:205 (-) Transcript_19811:723-1337(-)